MIIHGRQFSEPKPAGKPMRFDQSGVFVVIDRRTIDCMSTLPPRIIYVGTTDEMAVVAFPWRHPQYFAWITSVDSLSNLGLAISKTDDAHDNAALVEHIRTTMDIPDEHSGGLAALYRECSIAKGA